MNKCTTLLSGLCVRWHRFISGSTKSAFHQILLLLLPITLFHTAATAQNGRSGAADKLTPDGHLVQCVIIEGDTFVYQRLAPYVLLSPKTFKSRREEVRYTRLIRNVKRVYPYARLAGIKLEEYNDKLLEAKTDRERKRIMKQAEDELDAQFGKELRKLTFTQGVILLKLIDRETGQTGYELVAELRGAFRAFFWQGIGRLFGYNLKVTYDPKGADKDIEDIVIRIMYGQL
jgi:hypothetical protein